MTQVQCMKCADEITLMHNQLARLSRGNAKASIKTGSINKGGSNCSLQQPYFHGGKIKKQLVYLDLDAP